MWLYITFFNCFCQIKLHYIDLYLFHIPLNSDELLLNHKIWNRRLLKQYLHMKPLTKAIKISSSLPKVYNIFNNLILYSTARLKHAHIPTPSIWKPEVQVHTVICVCKTIMMPPRVLLYTYTLIYICQNT